MQPSPITITRWTPLDALPEFLRVEEYAVVHDVSKGAVYEMIRSGALAHVRIGRLIRISKSALKNGFRFEGRETPA